MAKDLLLEGRLGTKFSLHPVLRFSNISWFPKILSLNRLAPHEELLYKICFTTYQVQLYLWSIKHILNYCMVSKNYLAAILVAHKLLYCFIGIQYSHEN